ncbi:MAG: creatininase family protein [Candidatus Bathyarchaeia archaeon]
MKYAQALPFELEEELARKPVAYVPWGALEWHGEHLALGQDALKAEKICDLAAGKTGGVVLPLLFIGYRTMQLHGMPYTSEFSRELVKATFLELVRQLELVGFKLVVVLCGHYGRSHLAAIAEAAEEYSKTGKAKVLALPEYTLAEGYGLPRRPPQRNGRPLSSRASTWNS